jgi:hypothetical protein
MNIYSLISVKEVSNMPAFDKTGPQGAGRLTGRGFGPCGRGMGYGRSMGYGRGLGRYFGWSLPQTKEEKIKDTKVYLDALKEELEDVQKQLTKLQASA